MKSAEKTARNVAIAVIAVGGAAVMAYNQQVKAEARLESISKKVTKATNEQIQSMKELAAETQKVTSFGDEVIIAGQSQILSFGTTADQAEQLTGSLADLLAANKGVKATQDDAINAANMLGKALNGQAGALSRAGILLNDQQAELLKTGDQQTRVNTLIEIMQQNYGGLAQDLAKTPEGKLRQYANTMGDFGEIIGKVIFMGLEPLLSNLQKLADWLNKLDSDTIKMIVQFGLLAASIYPIIKAMLLYIKIMKFIKAGQIAILLTNPFYLILAAIVALGAMFIVLWNKSERFRSAVMSLKETFSTSFVKIMEALGLGKVGLDDILNAVFPIIEAIGIGLVKTIEFLAMVITAVITGAIAGFKGFVVAIRFVAGAIFDYLVTPLKLVLTLISKIPKIGGLAKSALSGINKVSEGLSGQEGGSFATVGRVAGNALQSNKQSTENINVDSSISIQVPPGTSANQSEFIQNQTRQVVREEMNRSMRQARRQNRRSE